MKANEPKNRTKIKGYLHRLVRCLFDPLILLCYKWKPELKITIQWKDVKTGYKYSQKDAIKNCENWDMTGKGT